MGLLRKVVIGACFIMAEAGPSDDTTADIALVWVINRKMPVIRNIRKSPRKAAPRIPKTVNIMKNTPIITTDCDILPISPSNALLLFLANHAHDRMIQHIAKAQQRPDTSCWFFVLKHYQCLPLTRWLQQYSVLKPCRSINSAS